jgi:NTE family protein
MPKADLVLEGGGVKGLGLVGAVLALMRAGYEFPRVAGTSAGAIVAAFLAAGVTADALAGIMERLDYARVPDRVGVPVPIPIVSEGVGLLSRQGAHPGDYIHGFVSEELERLGVRTFNELHNPDRGADADRPPQRAYRLMVTATDVTTGRLLRLPWDYGEVGLEADEQLVADAVRASLSIPLFFEPVTLAGRTLVDGGVLSNFPIESFDRNDGRAPRWPTFGVRVMPDLPAGDAQLFPGIALPKLPPVHLLEQVVATTIVGHDQTYLERPCVRRRTFLVDTSQVGIVQFDAPRRAREAVVANGERAAAEFLAGWSFGDYKRECRPSAA